MLDIGDISKIKLLSGIFDEIMVENGSSIPFDKDRKEWRYGTILLAKFQGDLNAGNVNFIDMAVQDIVIKKRKVEEYGNWTRVASIPYDKDDIKEYEFYDKYSESYQEYEYAFVPTMPQGIEGEYITDTIMSEFEDIFISDKDKHFKLRHNIDFGTSEIATNNAVFEPLGSRFPIVVANGDTNYMKGGLNALVMSEEDLELMNPRQQLEYRKGLTEFLTNNKPKVLKKPNGELYVIRLVDSPSVNYLNNTRGTLADISANYVEVAENTEGDLIRNGLLDGSVVR